MTDIVLYTRRHSVSEVIVRRAESHARAWENVFHGAHVGFARDIEHPDYVSESIRDARRIVYMQRHDAASQEAHIARELARSSGKPGMFYVSAVQAGAWRPLCGPYEKHEDALRAVEPVRRWVRARYDTLRVSFGTMRSTEYLDDVLLRPGEVTDGLV